MKSANAVAVAAACLVGLGGKPAVQQINQIVCGYGDVAAVQPGLGGNLAVLQFDPAAGNNADVSPAAIRR